MEEKEPCQKTMSEILQLIAPGTPIREGIDHVLRANTGGLIVMGYDDTVKTLVDGGFHINCPFSPSYLYELAKMDGAIILNDAGTRILIANAQLAPDSSIPSTETGMRHRTAERVAKQTKSLVIAISQRRHVITLYQGSVRYTLKEIPVMLTKANQAIQTLEKYKLVLDQSIANLTALEFEDIVTFNDLLQVMHRIEMVLRIKKELMAYLNELGTEGRLVRLQMKELLNHIEEEAVLIFKDYAYEPVQKPAELLRRFQDLVSSEMLEDQICMKLLGYNHANRLEDIVYPRGYRILHKIPRLPAAVIENLVQAFRSLSRLMKASERELDEVEGIGEVRAKKVKNGIYRIKEQMFIDRQL
ncbi:DNA integrity scanning protein DisA [Weizmannia acidilactici]|uniref:DNA integrity scanning protein DisA n=1 Tax=Weizmannia acidilactici TaxID=2607726 RepID=A0A5J4JHP1_9BACI|nr:DNA integrity scanning diadenylate cyclase DisA [Weizmannia acidilactici]GER67286.1 DNA integrity scanning protein DisA [Weizmannia acidilactici]GER69928.1 DNA integrity scanning protein DisA [Weizmannia acidilactici]GER73293.1 DNA integrity scanning protein DisA [Weizmannia acidilactici]